jgi:ABC-2 type transport system ATP-binding protein
MALIEIHHLSKTFGSRRSTRHRAVDGLDLRVEEGGVFGLLGPNGSGKTTTIRMLFGLVRPDSGQIRVLDRSVPDELPQVLPKIGSLIEGPLFFPAFSARRNLEILARVDRVGHAEVDRVLEAAGLAGRQHDSVKKYSLGMRQRLGIAAALLKRPRLLVLDEPTNGLDPAGVAQMREFITTLARGGDTTVLLSSHLLSEVEQVCDQVAILNHGAVIAAGSVTEIVASHQMADTVRLSVDTPSLAASLLREHGFEVALDGEGLLVSGGNTRRVGQILAAAGLEITEMTKVRASLEDAFISLTKGESQ